MTTHGGLRTNAGRKPLVKDGEIVAVLLPKAWLEKIAGNRSEFIRQAVLDKLIKDGGK